MHASSSSSLSDQQKAGGKAHDKRKRPPSQLSSPFVLSVPFSPAERRKMRYWAAEHGMQMMLPLNWLPPGMAKRKHTMTIRDGDRGLRWRCRHREWNYNFSVLVYFSAPLSPILLSIFVSALLSKSTCTQHSKLRLQGNLSLFSIADVWDSSEKIQRLPSCIPDQLHSSVFHSSMTATVVWKRKPQNGRKTSFDLIPPSSSSLVPFGLSLFSAREAKPEKSRDALDKESS